MKEREYESWVNHDSWAKRNNMSCGERKSTHTLKFLSEFSFYSNVFVRWIFFISSHLVCGLLVELTPTWGPKILFCLCIFLAGVQLPVFTSPHLPPNSLKPSNPNTTASCQRKDHIYFWWFHTCSGDLGPLFFLTISLSFSNHLIKVVSHPW